MPPRNGNMKSRRQLKQRTPSLGYYIIITDTQETEKNYVEGLRDSLPHDLRNNLVVKVIREQNTKDLLKSAMDVASKAPQFAELWIIFDRDQVKNFDKIISDAEKKEIKVGWSNPCIEIWFHAYWDDMPSCENSRKCVDLFSLNFQKRLGQKYDKADKDIYKKLSENGDVQRAFERADRKIQEHIRNKFTKPSQMCPATNVHTLVREILKKTRN